MLALERLGRDLDAPLSTIQWVSTGYLLAMFVTIPMAGWAQSVFGGKRLWIGALSLFLLGSVLCASAWDAPSLIAFRIVQGVGGGVMLPLMTTLIMQAAQGRNIGRVMATITLPVSLGPIFGPVLGGLILHLADWRWLFLVNVPFCLVGGVLAVRNLPSDKPAGRRTPLDTVGMLLLCPGVAAVVYGLSQVEGSAGIGSVRVLLPLVGGVALVVAFTLWALRARVQALVDLRLFRHRPLASASTPGLPVRRRDLRCPAADAAVLAAAARRGRPRGGALVLIPQGVGALVSRNIAGRCTDRYRPRWVAFTRLHGRVRWAPCRSRSPAPAPTRCC
ncbi:MFS transporter [Yinghuangia aomiensis]